MKRRTFLSLAAVGSLAAGMDPKKAVKEINKEKPKISPVPVIHETDLFHPHGDPDDHYDLATIFSFAFQGLYDLKAVVIDFPPNRRQGDPDVMGVAQLNYLTCLNVPIWIGNRNIMKSRNDTQPNATAQDHLAVNRIIEALKQSTEPVIINIVGSATDIAVASKTEPGLFKEKCKAVYLNSGSAHVGEKSELEYNVNLDPVSYSAIFDVPCPLYWIPCWHTTEKIWTVGENGSFYRFRQDDIFPKLSKRLLNFFLFMLSQDTSSKWLRYLEGEPDQEQLKKFSALERNMWCTAGFLHAAGLYVDTQGNIKNSLDEIKNPLFIFEPIDVSCDDKGFNKWQKTDKSTNRFILKVNNIDLYTELMTKALAAILGSIQ
jgi:hypothetical protein